VLSDGDTVQARAGEHGVRFLLLAAQPLREPVVQYGPFVMKHARGDRAGARRLSRRASCDGGRERSGSGGGVRARDERVHPFHAICTPMQSRMNALSRTTTPVPVGPSLRMMISA